MTNQQNWDKYGIAIAGAIAACLNDTTHPEIRGFTCPIEGMPTLVELSSFTASVTGSTVTLQWTTAREVNNHGFEVEREDGELEKSDRNWQKVAFLPAYEQIQKAYMFTDENLVNGYYVYRLKQIDLSGTFDYSDEVKAFVNNIPIGYALEQNYPNPFNPETTIRFSVPKLTNIQINIYNELGQLVRTLVDEIKPAGEYRVIWDGRNGRGEIVSSGVYLYQMRTDRVILQRKIVFLR